MILFFTCFYEIFYLNFITFAEPLTKVQSRQKEGPEEEYSFEGALAASKKSVIQDSMSVLLVTNELVWLQPTFLLLQLKTISLDSLCFDILFSSSPKKLNYAELWILLLLISD